MKICSKCNTQFDDAQNFCSVCGGELTSDTAPVTVVAPASEPAVITIMNFISKVLSAIAFLFMGWALADPWIDSDFWYSEYSNNFYVDSWYRLREEPALIFMAAAMAAFVFATIGFIMTLVKKQKMEKKLLQSQINPHFLYNTLPSIVL